MGVALFSQDRGGTGDDPYLTTVKDFAEQHRVDASVVRMWVKQGHIPYVLVGPRKMRRVDGKRTATPVAPTQLDPNVLKSRDQLVSHLVVYSGMTEPIAREVVNGMGNDEVASMMTEFLEADNG